jgi:hypothetical protein
LKNNIRYYHSIKFFRGKKRKIADLLRLAEARQDFEYRRLLIEECELNLHVYFSRMTVYNWLSWSFIALTFCYFKHPVIIPIILGLALLFRIFSWIYKNKFKSEFRSYNLALALVDGVICNEHGISLR